MRTPRTKKSPTPSTAKKTGAGLPKGSPKGSGPSVPPTFEERVASLEKHVESLTALFAYVGEGIPRSIPEGLATDAVVEVLGDREDAPAREAVDALLRWEPGR